LRGLILLCDAAEVLNGKLYILGGGWTKILITPQRPTVNLTISAVVYFSWVDTNQQKTIDISLFTQDGHLVNINDNPIQVRGPVEVGRPPGLVNGTEIELPLATRFEGLELSAGRYEWRMSIDEELLASAIFDVLDARAH